MDSQQYPLNLSLVKDEGDIFIFDENVHCYSDWELLGAVVSLTFHSFKGGSSQTVHTIPLNGFKRKIRLIRKMNYF